MRRTFSFHKIISLVLLAALGAVSASACKKEAGETEQKGPAAATARGVVIMNTAAQEQGGIAAAPLQPMTYRKKIQAYGTVIDLQELFAARNRVAEAKAEVEKTRAGLEASQKAYERLKTLYGEAQDVSAKSLEAAEAAWQSNKAAASAAQVTLEAVETSARQQWGNVIAAWLIEASPDLDRLSRRQTVLVLLTLPPDVAAASGPRTVMVRIAEGKSVPAQRVSASPRTDPRIQGMSFFYLAPAGPDLVSGMNVEASMPSGPRVKGVFIPAPAVVWQQGRAWVYVQEGGDRFVRREVPVENPVKDGYFSAKGFTAGERIVVKGAQVLLSAESLPATRHEEED